MSHVTSSLRPPLITGGKTYGDVTEDIVRQVEGKPTKLWSVAFLLSLITLAIGAYGLYRVFW